MCRGDTQRNLIVEVQEMKAQGNQQRAARKSSEAGYQCVCLNARSIVNKRNNRDNRIVAYRDILDVELGLNGYAMFRKDGIGRKGGGVILYIKEAIQAYELKLD